MAGLYTKLFVAQGGRCFHCFEPMDAESFPKKVDGWTREHVVPRVHGGKDAWNIVLAHSACNSRRGSALPSEAMLQRAHHLHLAARGLGNKDVDHFFAPLAAEQAARRRAFWAQQDGLGSGGFSRTPPS